MANYQHSKTFDQLKRVKESISTNYTSLQYLQTLNHFLWKALEPIAQQCPQLFKGYLCKIVARQTLKSSAKFTSNERAVLPAQLFNILAASDEKLADAAMVLNVNRGLMFGFISFFLKRTGAYKTLHQQAKTGVISRSICWQIETQLGARPDGDLYSALMTVEYWAAKAREWKDQIVEKYTRMALLQAQSTYKDYNHAVDLDDVVQIYLLVVSKSIDRCDARHGVITTFMQSWFKSAKSEVAKLAEAAHDSSYESMVEDHGDAIHDVLGTTDPDTSSELWQHISYIAKCCDPEGVVRTAMHIPQYVTLKHRKLLEEFAVE